MAATAKTERSEGLTHDDGIRAERGEPASRAKPEALTNRQTERSEGLTHDDGIRAQRGEPASRAKPEALTNRQDRAQRGIGGKAPWVGL